MFTLRELLEATNEDQKIKVISHKTMEEIATFVNYENEETLYGLYDECEVGDIHTTKENMLYVYVE